MGIRFWWYPTGGLTGSGRQCFFAGTDDSEWFGFAYDQGNQKLLLEVANSSGTWQSLGSPTGTKNNFTTGQWYHIAIARTSDTNVSWYVDGVLDKSVTVASGTIRCQSNPRLGEWEEIRFGIIMFILMSLDFNLAKILLRLQLIHYIFLVLLLHHQLRHTLQLQHLQLARFKVMQSLLHQQIKWEQS